MHKLVSNIQHGDECTILHALSEQFFEIADPHGERALRVELDTANLTLGQVCKKRKGIGPSLCNCSQYAVPKSRRLWRLLWNTVLHRNCTRLPLLYFKYLTYFFSGSLVATVLVRSHTMYIPYLLTTLYLSICNSITTLKQPVSFNNDGFSF